MADSSGQVIPAAEVTLSSEHTGEQRKATTNEVGDFVFPALVPGRYTIRVESKGFRPSELKGNDVLSSARLAVGTIVLEVASSWFLDKWQISASRPSPVASRKTWG